MNPMHYTRYLTTRVLALDPFYKGLAFTLLEGPTRLLDWGLKHVEIKTPESYLREVDALIDFYQPEVLVLEDGYAPGSRRHPRVAHLIQEINTLAIEKDASTRLITREQVRDTFCLFTKYEIAQAIKELFPELATKLPPARKVSQSEDVRMNLFDAAALALTYFYKNQDE